MTDPVTPDNYFTRGHYALIGAIVNQAAWDAINGEVLQRVEAARYFGSRDYTHHLELLDQPIDRLPAGLLQWTK